MNLPSSKECWKWFHMNNSKEYIEKNILLAYVSFLLVVVFNLIRLLVGLNNTANLFPFCFFFG